MSIEPREDSLEERDMPRMYLAHHKLAGVLVSIVYHHTSQYVQSFNNTLSLQATLLQ